MRRYVHFSPMNNATEINDVYSNSIEDYNLENLFSSLDQVLRSLEPIPTAQCAENAFDSNSIYVDTPTNSSLLLGGKLPLLEVPSKKRKQEEIHHSWPIVKNGKVAIPRLSNAVQHPPRALRPLLPKPSTAPKSAGI